MAGETHGPDIVIGPGGFSVPRPERPPIKGDLADLSEMQLAEQVVGILPSFIFTMPDGQVDMGSPSTRIGALSSLLDQGFADRQPVGSLERLVTQEFIRRLDSAWSDDQPYHLGTGKEGVE